MTSTLPPISSPFAFFGGLGISSMLVGEILFALVVFMWAVYTAVAIYHWLRYSHAALIAIPAIVVHLAVSVLLILFALSGLVAA